MGLKRLAPSDSVGSGDFVAMVENHADPLSEEVRRAAAQVRVQHTRVQAQIARLQQQRKELDTDLGRCNERAAKLADSDQPRAPEWLHRGRRVEARLGAVEAQLDEHLRLADELGERLHQLEQRLNDPLLRRPALSSRPATARPAKRGRIACGDSPKAISDPSEASALADEYRDDLSLQGADAPERPFRDEQETAATTPWYRTSHHRLSQPPETA